MTTGRALALFALVAALVVVVGGWILTLVYPGEAARRIRASHSSSISLPSRCPTIVSASSVPSAWTASRYWVAAE